MKWLKILVYGLSALAGAGVGLGFVWALMELGRASVRGDWY